MINLRPVARCIPKNDSPRNLIRKGRRLLLSVFRPFDDIEIARLIETQASARQAVWLIALRTRLDAERHQRLCPAGIEQRQPAVERPGRHIPDFDIGPIISCDGQ
jgi:hypothetical protein